MKRFFSVNICTVYCSLLCYQYQFFHTFLSHFSGLGKQALHRNASEFTSKLWNNAISAVLVTAFCYLQVSKMAACSQDTPAQAFRQIINTLEFLKLFPIHCFLDCSVNILIGSGSQYCIYLRNLFSDFIFVTLSHTSGNDQSLTASCLFILCHLQDCIYALFLSIINKAAGIDNDYLCQCFIIYDLKSFSGQKSKHFLRIYQILIAA